MKDPVYCYVCMSACPFVINYLSHDVRFLGTTEVVEKFKKVDQVVSSPENKGQGPPRALYNMRSGLDEIQLGVKSGNGTLSCEPHVLVKYDNFPQKRAGINNYRSIVKIHSTSTHWGKIPFYVQKYLDTEILNL